MLKIKYLLILGEQKINQIFTLKDEDYGLENYPHQSIFINSLGISRHHAGYKFIAAITKFIRYIFGWLFPNTSTFVSQETGKHNLKIEEQYDQLTNLPNRSLFSEELSVAIERSSALSEIANAKREKYQIAVMFLDLDRFKKINDTLGHQAGDQVLKLFVRRVKSCLRINDIFARWGGDEFAILLPNITGEEDLRQISERIIDLLQAPVQVFGYELYIKTSIGIAMYPRDGETGETLLKNTDIALSSAKNNGRNNFQFYNLMLHKNTTKMLTMEHCLYQALENREFFLHYQPQLNLKTGTLYGVEALLRWENTDLGQISPYEFIPLAEETGLIEPIGEWVLENACAQTVAWQKAGLSKLQVSVNISPIQLKNTNFIGQIKAILKKTGLSPYLLDLEITENSLMEDITSVRDNLRQLLQMGVQISLDDFGTGYSSLSYLKNFPFHTLKIDQSFIRNLKYSPQDIALISAIISIGDSFNMRVIAEGAEYIEQIELLTSLGCDHIQGYWVSKPLPAQQIEGFIHNYHLTDYPNISCNMNIRSKRKSPLSIVA